MKETTETTEEIVILPKEVMKELEDDFLSCCKSNNTPPKYEEEVELTLTLQKLEKNLDKILLNKNLKTLFISDGQIPLNILNELSSMGKLEGLIISQYTDETILKQTFNNLSKFRNLKSLTLFNSKSFEKLPDEICKLTSLTHLTIYLTTISELPADIGNLTNLLSLDVFGNKLRSLPKSIIKLQNLSDLTIDDYLTHESNYLSKNMPNLKEVLNIDRNLENMIKIP